MVRACSCQDVSMSDYHSMTLLLQDQVRVAPTFGKAVGVIFRATHPKEQTTPADFSARPKSCQECTPHIGRIIVQYDLRPKAEFDAWMKDRDAVMEKCGGKCSRASACANGFDMSPLCP